jgi:hypothetical protein
MDPSADSFGPDLDSASDDVEVALTAADPEPLIALLAGPGLDIVDGCPTVERLASAEGVRELWTGDCIQTDGTFISGRLERFEGASTGWVSGEGFGIYRNGRMEMFIDGAVSLSGEGGLWLVDATATTCSASGWNCADGTVSVDLAFTVFPTEGYPSAYEVTVSGVVASDASPIVIDGAWSIDRETCGVEPTGGMIAIQRGVHQTLQLDGAVACDACADWVLQGRPVSAYCATSF